MPCRAQKPSKLRLAVFWWSVTRVRLGLIKRSLSLVLGRSLLLNLFTYSLTLFAAG